MKVLVTGFEPFGGDPVNPSIRIAREMRRQVGRYDVVSEVLPVVYGRSLEMLHAMIRAERPDCVLCLGLAGGRTGLAVEIRAQNVMDARIPDNDGRQPRGEPIDPRAPGALGPRLPVRSILRELAHRGVTAESSRSAGTYLCNYVFYGLARHIARSDPALLGGFIHVPWMRDRPTDRPGAPALDLATLVRGVESVLDVLSR